MYYILKSMFNKHTQNNATDLNNEEFNKKTWNEQEIMKLLVNTSIFCKMYQFFPISFC